MKRTVTVLINMESVFYEARKYLENSKGETISKDECSPYTCDCISYAISKFITQQIKASFVTDKKGINFYTENYKVVTDYLTTFGVPVFSLDGFGKPEGEYYSDEQQGARFAWLHMLQLVAKDEQPVLRVEVTEDNTHHLTAFGRFTAKYISIA